MKYRVGFRNGMVITVEANSLSAVAHNDMRFETNEKQVDLERYLRATEVLFVAPLESLHVDRPAVAAITVEK